MIYEALRSYYKSSSSRFFPILGMHRSGTSLLSRILHQKGVNMGNRLDANPSFGNQDGHYEDKEPLAINTRLLKLNGGNWQNPPESFNPLTYSKKFRYLLCRFRMLRYIHSRSSENWGFKDPRLVLTFSLWKRELSNQKLKPICIFRQPEDVVSSLVRRESMNPIHALNLWKLYNRYLLIHIDTFDEYLLLQYKDFAEDPLRCDELLNRVCPETEAKVSSLTRSLNHSRYNEFVGSEAQEIFKELKRYKS